MRRLSALQDEVDSWRGLSSRVTDALDLVELAILEQDETIVGDLGVEREPLALHGETHGLHGAQQGAPHVDGTQRIGLGPSLDSGV